MCSLLFSFFLPTCKAFQRNSNSEYFTCRNFHSWWHNCPASVHSIFSNWTVPFLSTATELSRFCLQLSCPVSVTSNWAVLFLSPAKCPLYVYNRTVLFLSSTKLSCFCLQQVNCPVSVYNWTVLFLSTTELLSCYLPQLYCPTSMHSNSAVLFLSTTELSCSCL